jgi:hypothetical protein
MRTTIFLLLVVLAFSCKEKTKHTEEVSQQTKAQDVIKNDWIVLFDGTSFDGWHFYGGETIGAPWKLEEGAMVFYPPSERPEGASYNIVTDQEFKSFELSLEWRISKNGNSGIFWGIFEDEKFGQPYETGPEIQVLDNMGHPDAKNGTDRQAGALYDMVSPSEDVTKPAGEWNTVVITINHETNNGSVVQNGTKIVEFPANGEGWDALVANSKFATWEGFGNYPTGKIGLQDHGDIVAYRNIKIKKL